MKDAIVFKRHRDGNTTVIDGQLNVGDDFNTRYMVIRDGAPWIVDIEPVTDLYSYELSRVKVARDALAQLNREGYDLEGGKKILSKINRETF